MGFDFGGLVGEAADWLSTAAKTFRERAAGEDAVILDGVPRAVQLDSYSCGAQCVYMVLAYHGNRRNYRKLVKRLGTNEDDGTSESAICRVLREEGLRPKIVDKARLPGLRKVIDSGTPVIALVDDEEHWIVVHGYDDDGFYVSDPSPLRAVYLGEDEFKDRWDRYVIVVRG